MNGRSIGTLLLLQLLDAKAVGEDRTGVGVVGEEERLSMPKEELLVLADDCCYWGRRERVPSMTIFERETCDREREGVVGGLAGVKGGRVVGGYAKKICYAIVFFLSVMFFFCQNHRLLPPLY